MNYVSTRGQAPAVSIGAALRDGLAPDGGLYVPAALPRLSAVDFDGLVALPAIAERLLRPFFAGDPLHDALAPICADAFDFPAPLKPFGGDGSRLLELFHGPTAAFKDFGARFLAECLARTRAPADPVLTILVATSGDTGAAVAAAFHRRHGFRVVILYPDGRVSPRQAHQLGCFGDNVQALRVAGSFDDCQRLVKQALADADLRERCPLSSANSISLGRLLPQMAYYAAAALEWARTHPRPLGLIVPTGNLGNALAAILVRAIGLPLGPVVLANNANRVLADFFAGADYAPRVSVATLANAMDVGAPSNFERLAWLYPEPARLREAVTSQSVEDAEIRATIAATATRRGIVVCPHTACAAAVLERLRAAGDRGDYAVVATAHPAKFERIVEPLAGHVEPPPALADLLARPATAEPLDASYGALRERLLG
ncbi:MAG TPA: threonine synthase [Dokdonella sp.]|uniref:threonine synthase n=1 Tax=Dokdonella sp. TaxID=2291710 RepID=UPI002B627B8E|nr:threonine synthase [Dokdonella sp.]HUD43651.1 threonine synthase [Dokdonella sp.]